MKFELTDCLRSIRTRTKYEAQLHTSARASPGAAVALNIIGTESDKFESFFSLAKFCSFRSFWDLEFWLERYNQARSMSAVGVGQVFGYYTRIDCNRGPASNAGHT